jgi:hypothetical protein
MMAIQGTSPKTLRSVMWRMCKENSQFRNVAASFLLIQASSVPKGTSGQASEGKKRKLEDLNEEVLVPKYDTCARRDEEFNVAPNEGEHCCWHIGTLSIS